MSEDLVSDVLDAVQIGAEETEAELVRRNTPISYWCKWFPGVKYSPRQFYASVEQKLHECEIPDLVPDKIYLKQRGILSAKRLYLRCRREKLVFEMCAAPFGTGFFVSSRLFDRRREARLIHILAALLIISIPVGLVWLRFGLIWSVVILGGIIALILSLMRMAATDVLSSLDRILPEIPLLGLIYERFFHPNTFFRQDTNACYRAAVHDVVMSAIDEMTAAQGLEPLSREERQLILGEQSK